MKRFNHLIIISLVLLVAACSVKDFMVLTNSVMTTSIPVPAKKIPSPWSKEEIRCLALTVYGEARNQPFHGQVAVGAVVVSRSLNPKYPKDLCEVVKQKNQFAGYWAALSISKAGKVQRDPWKVAMAAAAYATDGYGYLPAQYRKVFFFTLKGENSAFHKTLPLIGRIQDHDFYGMK